jgi:hypothetical protein
MAIAEAAHVSLGAVRGWLRKPELKSLLREAVLAARKGKSPESDGFKQLDRRMRECMLLYAKASTKAARCKDENVDIKPQQLDQLLQEAAGRGVKEDLLQYLNYKGPYRAISFRKQHGLINGKLFVIPPAMCRFHDVAVKEWHRQNLAELERLPGFDAWFAAWVTPAIHDGQAPSAPVELDQHRPIVNHPAETQTTTADSKSGITDRQRLILETMLDMDIASEASKEPQSVILRKINPNLDTNNYKRAFAGLHKRGLIDSIKGPDGGVWLTDEGKREAVLD